MIAHLGPTNSGKTHDALRFLVENGRGVYAAPLRMLAQEAHRRLAAEVGEDKVGLVTGEERVNPDAPIICCTAEMAPMHGETLVLDEVQWAEDEERGSAWTRLMLGGEYRHILLLGAVEALPLVRHAFPQVEVRFFERKAPLDWLGRRGIAGLGPGTVVVAFSRRAVIGLAGELNQFHPGKVAVLYGAMPLASRREEIDRFISGAAEVCAATDVLGHGVNLPCETLLFAETDKFDGRRAPRPRVVGDRADRGPRGPLRLSRAGACRRAHRRAVGASGSGARARGADPARGDRGGPLRLSHRRHGAAAAAALRPQRHAGRRARACAARLAADGIALLEHRGLADGRVDPAATRAARRGA